MTALKIDRGMALQDILRDFNDYLMHMKLPDDVLMDLFDKVRIVCSSHFAQSPVQLAEVEHRLTKGANEKVQLSAVVAIFQQAREKITY